MIRRLLRRVWSVLTFVRIIVLMLRCMLLEKRVRWNTDRAARLERRLIRLERRAELLEADLADWN